MSDADKFRERARDCRALAKSARNPADAALLNEIADELDAEADKSDRGERPVERGVPTGKRSPES